MKNDIFLHPSMVLYETPLSEKECRYYFNNGIDLNNQDFLKWKIENKDK